ncbi:MAG: aldo/keto reductase [SAR202 cluster bacterium]|nr:aldo/keto reductase [SAR202 cluster bacterium]|tara:strand:- start:9015 stop:10019 length:1005 start_codon:yes stop_codon:yes gene_type:complete
MKYVEFGRTGINISPLVLGTMMFGGRASKEDSFEMIDYALDCGINIIDTANVYASSKSETIVGEALNRNRKRNDVILATKVNGSMGEGPNDSGNSRHHIIQQCEASLNRMQVDHIDLYQFHRPSKHIAIDESLRAMDDLVRSGKVRYIGTSNFGSWQVVEALWASKELGLNRFVSDQSPYNMADRRIEREHIPMCQTYGLAQIPWSPLAGGGLTGKYSKSKIRPKGSRYADETDPKKQLRMSNTVVDIVDALIPIAKSKGCTISQLSLAWVMSRPGVTAPLTGPRTLDQLKDNLGAINITIEPEVDEILNKIVPPGEHVAEYYEASFAPNAHHW